MNSASEEKEKKSQRKKVKKIQLPPKNIPVMDKIVLCPYDSNHQIRASRMQYHLLKCEKNYPDWGPCPFNNCHRFPKQDIKPHLKVCSNKAIDEWNDEPSLMRTPYARVNPEFNMEFENWLQK